MIQYWDDIKNNYQDTLILGNGASIAVCELFEYKSLYEKAKECGLIDKSLEKIFEKFKTTNFENVLHKLSIAEIINKTLNINNSSITESYEKCRLSLIKTIQKVHPKYDEIDQNHFIKIVDFLKNFKTVINLNYDLILYWVMKHGNEPISDGEKKDMEIDLKIVFL